MRQCNCADQQRRTGCSVMVKTVFRSIHDPRILPTD